MIFVKVGAKIVQRITGNSAGDVAHSSGLAEMRQDGLQRRGGMSFMERQNIEQNRKLVQGYKNSRIARDFGVVERSGSTYGRSETPTRTGYGRTEGEVDKRCRYGRTETADRSGYGRKSAEEVRNERMASPAMPARKSSSPGAPAPKTNSRMKSYYNFGPDLNG